MSSGRILVMFGGCTASIFRAKSNPNNQQVASRMQPNILFNHEDGGSTHMFLQNIGELLPDYTALYPRR
jgi:hypothetical protein